MLDLTLAIIHHLAIFSLFGLLVAEIALVRGQIDSRFVRVIGAVDIGYGATSGIIIVAGFLRAIYAAKGWAYYSHNEFFWAKVGTFCVIALISIRPTLRFIKWRRMKSVPLPVEVAKVEPLLWIQFLLFLSLPVFAAAMARGFGEF